MRKQHFQLQRRKNPGQGLEPAFLWIQGNITISLLSREFPPRNQVVPESNAHQGLSWRGCPLTQREAPHSHRQPALWSCTQRDHLQSPPQPPKMCGSSSYTRRSQHRSWSPGNEVTGPEGYFVPKPGVPRWGRGHQKVYCPDQERGEQEGGALSVGPRLPLRLSWEQCDKRRLNCT